jgi:solute carrier family 34 (sodium-dependent phosphate cotransporter)
MEEQEAVPRPRRAGAQPPPAIQALRFFGVLFFLYVFLVGVKAIETGIGSFGEAVVDAVFSAVANPISALAAGTLATVLLQSSSASTSIIVGLVGAGVLGVEAAVPMVMGANIGTTVTSTLAALGHVRQGAYFERAFSAATVHDAFNLLSVILFLPLEVAFGLISKTARLFENLLDGVLISSGPAGRSWIREAVSAPVGWIRDVLDTLSWSGALGPVLLVLGLAFIFLGLSFITRLMKELISSRIEGAINTLLGRGGGSVAILVGLTMTVAVQSSSITTSIMVPLVAAGLLVLENAYPVTVGANIGTTITALIASVASGTPEALTIALAHVSFNIYGTVAFYGIPPARQLPLAIARRLARLAVTNKTWLVVYVVGGFLVIPVLLLILF